MRKNIIKLNRRAAFCLVVAAFSLVCATFFDTKLAFAALTQSLSNTAGTDIFDWPLDNVGETNVILLPEQVRIKKENTTYNSDNYDFQTFVPGSGSYYDIPATDVAGENCVSIRYKKALAANTTYYPTNLVIKFPKAARKITGETYDLEMTISGIAVATKKKRDKGVPIVWGCTESFKFGAFPYEGDGHGGYHGVKYTITIKLYKAGTKTRIENNNDNSMLWGFEDIDVPDMLSSGEHTYSSSHTWAEHVEIGSGNYIEPFYVSNDTHLTVSKNSTSKKVTIYNGVKWGGSGREDVMYRVNPYEFTYTWKGSNCGTTAVAVAGIIYQGYSWVDAGSSFTRNNETWHGYPGNQGYPNGSTHTVKANSQQVVFYHAINRNNSGPNGDKESYYVEVQSGYSNSRARKFKNNQLSNSRPHCGKTSPCEYVSNKGSKTTVYTPGYPEGNPITVSMHPGETKHVWQRLHYQLSNVNSTLGALSIPYKGGACTWSGSDGWKVDNPDSTICLHLYRPPAYFTANVSSEVNVNGGSSYVKKSAAASDSRGIKVTSSDGSFKIRFGGKIQRLTSSSTPKDNAGGTVTSRYATYMTYNTYNGTQVPNTRNPLATDDPATYATDALGGDNLTHNVFTSKNVYTGTLRYDEQITICGVVTYRDQIDYRILKPNGDVKGYRYAPTPAYDCVTVYRDPKTCDMNGSYRYGVYSGENLGSIGVVNHTLDANDAGFHFTSNNPTSYANATNHTLTSAIYARPGDSIRFYYKICAGGAYAVNNSSISESSNRTSYTASTTKTGYLFGKTIPGVKTASPLKYNDSATWTSNTTSWLKDQAAEKVLASPSLSSTDPTAYDRDTYNRRSYSCINLNPRSNTTSKTYSALDGHYQIAGRETATGTDCHAYTKTGVTSDVGSTIEQNLSWNHIKVTGSATTTPSASGVNDIYTAKAKVKVPYNYIVQASLSAPTESHIVYLGDTTTFSSNIYVLPRTNSAFGSDPLDNKYATITKKSSISLRYYFKRANSTATYGDTTVDSQTDVRLNKNGLFNGTAGNNATIANGGHTYKNFSVFINDNNVNAGDKLCAEVIVVPADSHNSPSTASVVGEKATSTSSGTPALSESYDSSNREIRTTCYTVAKKPTMSVEAANAFAGGNKGFVTSRYTKKFSAAADATQYVFGSWSEYGVYGRVLLNNGHGIASGATFGYATQNNGFSESQRNAARSNSGNVASSSNNGNNTCVFSTQTFVNSNCTTNPSTIGRVGFGNEQADEFRKRIHDRFAASNGSKAPVTTNDYEIESRCTWLSDLTVDRACVKNDKNEKYANIRHFMNKTWDNNGINRTYIVGDAYLGSGNTFLTLWANHNFKNKQQYEDPDTHEVFADRNYTRLIEVKGTLVIDADIKVGRYEEKTNYWGQVVSIETDDDPALGNSGEVVQFIIIADKVKITSRVSRIDAIIIADEVDTCAYNIPLSGATNTNNGFKKGLELEVGASNKNNSLSASTCDNAIVFRGPVATKKITLNRTYGAEGGSASSKRAEIFDLNPYTYLWSYGQMTRYSQAVTTFTRELAPRY